MTKFESFLKWWLCIALFLLLPKGLAQDSTSVGDDDGFREVNGVYYRVVSTNGANTNATNAQVKITFTTPAYNKEAFRRVLQEANKIAQELRLPEKLPITENDVVERFIAPYGITRIRPYIGKIHTRDWGYYVSVGQKMSYVEGTHQEQDCLKWMENYRWPRARIDTNAAYQLATQWLAAASMDVAGLNRDCLVRVAPEQYWNEANPKKRTTFVPIYDVVWRSPEQLRENFGMVAAVRLFAPTKALLSLSVEESTYILRKPLVFTNLDGLLSQTNIPAKH